MAIGKADKMRRELKGLTTKEFLSQAGLDRLTPERRLEVAALVVEMWAQGVSVWEAVRRLYPERPPMDYCLKCSTGKN